MTETKTILIVDDEENTLRGLKQGLASAEGPSAYTLRVPTGSSSRVASRTTVDGQRCRAVPLIFNGEAGMNPHGSYTP